MSFPNLLELSFIVVLAFPKASSIGFICNESHNFLSSYPFHKTYIVTFVFVTFLTICINTYNTDIYFVNDPTSTICSASLVGSCDFDIRASWAIVIFVLSVLPTNDIGQ